MRNSPKSSLKGIVSVFVAGIMLISYFIIKIINTTPAEPPEDRMVLVASKNLEQGDVISIPDMIWKEFSADNIKPDFIKKNQHDLIHAIEGAIVRTPVLKGDAISDENIIKTGTKSALSTVVHYGMRAVPVPFSKLANAPTLIAPGDIVDIIIPKRVPGQAQIGPDTVYEAQTILKGIKILAVDTALQKTELSDSKGSILSTNNNAHTITLEVNDKQAEDLAESIREGQIVISMHSVFAGDADLQSRIKDPQPVIPLPKIKKEEQQKIIKVLRGADAKNEPK